MKRRLAASAKFLSLLESKSRVFNTRTLAALWGLKAQSAKVEACRLVKSGVLVPLRRGWYCVAEREPDDLELANALYQPSVISLETALNYWGMLVQVPQIVTSIADRSRRFVVRGTEFTYRRVPPLLLTVGTVKENGCIMAGPEKSVLDYLYFGLKGGGRIGRGSLSLDRKVDLEKARRYLMCYPPAWRQRLLGEAARLMKRGYRGIR